MKYVQGILQKVNMYFKNVKIRKINPKKTDKKTHRNKRRKKNTHKVLKLFEQIYRTFPKPLQGAIVLARPFIGAPEARRGYISQ